MEIYEKNKSLKEISFFEEPDILLELQKYQLDIFDTIQKTMIGVRVY